MSDEKKDNLRPGDSVDFTLQTLKELEEELKEQDLEQARADGRELFASLIKSEAQKPLKQDLTIKGGSWGSTLRTIFVGYTYLRTGKQVLDTHKIIYTGSTPKAWAKLSLEDRERAEELAQKIFLQSFRPIKNIEVHLKPSQRELEVVYISSKFVFDSDIPALHDRMKSTAQDFRIYMEEFFIKTTGR